MSKQNEESLSSLRRARPQRQSLSDASAGDAADDTGRDVIVPSFLWEPPREDAASEASSWKEEPAPVRRRPPLSAERTLPETPPVPLDREEGRRDAEDDDFTPHGGRAYVFTSRAGRKTLDRADVSEAFEAAQPPLREHSAAGSGATGRTAAASPSPGETDAPPRRADDAPDAHAESSDIWSRADVHEPLEASWHDDGERSRNMAASLVRREENRRSLAAALEALDALPHAVDDEDDPEDGGVSPAALASGEEDRRELEAALAARGIAPRRPFRREPARRLSDDMAPPVSGAEEPARRAERRDDARETAGPLRDDMIFSGASSVWATEEPDGVSAAALASGEEDRRELEAALAASGIAPRRTEERREPAPPPRAGEAPVSAAPAPFRDDAEVGGTPEETSPAPESPRDDAPADFAATPDGFLAGAGTADDEIRDASGGERDGAAPAGDEPESGERSDPPEPPRPPEPADAGLRWLRRFFLALALLAVVTLGLLLPYSFWWVYASGDVAVERAVAMQAEGKFAIFGSGVSQDFVDYKLRLYEAVKPEIAVIGSSRVMQFRGSNFRQSFVNVGGTAGNLSVLRSTIDAMLKAHRPKAVIIGLDFWWFSRNWQKDPFAPEPPTSGTYVYDLETLKAPWKWLLEGKIGWGDFFAPLTGRFRDDRFGIMAQRSDDGFASDGSWHYTADATGRQRPFDYRFGDTLKQVRYGIKAFAPASELSEAHLDAFAEIYCRLKSRGIQTYVFIAPLSATVLDAMRERQADYPHLFNLYAALMERGIDVMDFTDPRKFGSSDCEFVDGFHGGEVTYTRILRDLVDRYHSLVAYVDVERVNRVLKEWKGHATVYDERVTTLPETDFMDMSCPKKQR